MTTANDNRPAEFDALVLSHRKGLHAYALRRYGEDAEDLVHDTLANALTRWTAFRPDGKMYSWLIRMLRHTHAAGKRDAGRLKRAATRVDGNLPDVPIPATQEDAASVAMALARLSERQAGILVMQACEYTFTEIGARYGFAKQRAKQLADRAVNDVVAAATRADTRRAVACGYAKAS